MSGHGPGRAATKEEEAAIPLRSPTAAANPGAIGSQAMKFTCRRNIKSSVLALLVAGSAAFVAACSGGSPSAPSGGGSGSGSGSTPGSSLASTVVAGYRLITVNGHSVPDPFAWFSPDSKQTMKMKAKSGRIVMNDDGTFTHDRETWMTGTNVPKPVVSVIGYVGMYSLQGATLTMTPYQGTPLNVTYTPGKIEILTTAPGLDGRDDKFVWTYAK